MVGDDGDGRGGGLLCELLPYDDDDDDDDEVDGSD